MKKVLVGKQDAAHILSVSRATVDRMVKLGKLRPIWLGGAVRFSPDELARFGKMRGRRITLTPLQKQRTL
jgi:excisionase family DNA binding protein